MKQAKGLIYGHKTGEIVAFINENRDLIAAQKTIWEQEVAGSNLVAPTIPRRPARGGLARAELAR